MGNESPLLNEKEAAEYLRVTVSWLRDQRNNGRRVCEVPCVRLGRHVRYHRDVLAKIAGGLV